MRIALGLHHTAIAGVKSNIYQVIDAVSLLLGGAPHDVCQLLHAHVSVVAPEAAL